MSRVEGDREEWIRFFFFLNVIILVNLNHLFWREGGSVCLSFLKKKKSGCV